MFLERHITGREGNGATAKNRAERTSIACAVLLMYDASKQHHLITTSTNVGINLKAHSLLCFLSIL